jgi:hypothetical protein
MPYAMTRMHLHGRAVEGYNDAIELLYAEKSNLDESITAIERGELLEILENQDLRSGSGWLQELTMDTRSPALRYQTTLMAAHDFQEAVKNFRDLLTLRNNLQGWADSMDAYDDMLSARRERFNANRPAAERALGTDDRMQLENRHRELRQRLAEIEAAQDPVGLAKPTELGQWNTIQKISRKLGSLPVNTDTRLLRERLSRVEGALYWKLSSAYKPRLWQARRQLADISGLLDESAQALQSLDTARTTVPAGFGSFADRIAANRVSIHALLDRTRTLQAAQGRYLEHLALAALEDQKERIDTYIVQARFSLAQTFDHARQSGREVAR